MFSVYNKKGFHVAYKDREIDACRLAERVGGGYFDINAPKGNLFIIKKRGSKHTIYKHIYA